LGENGDSPPYASNRKEDPSRIFLNQAGKQAGRKVGKNAKQLLMAA
jgi:hypothetical protein